MTEYRFAPESPIITLYAKLTNTRVRWLLMALDTGATYTMIPLEIVEALGFEPAMSKRKVDVITASGVEKAPLVILGLH